MLVARSLALFAVAAVAEIGGAYLVWQGLREGHGWPWIVLGGLGLTLYGVVATFQPEANFGRIFAAYGGIFIVGSILWGMAFEGFRPDRWDVIGGAICLLGMAVIMYAPPRMTPQQHNRPGPAAHKAGPVLAGLGLAAAWSALAWARPATTWHLASVLIAVAPVWIDRQTPRRPTTVGSPPGSASERPSPRPPPPSCPHSGCWPVPH